MSLIPFTPFAEIATDLRKTAKE